MLLILIFWQKNLVYLNVKYWFVMIKVVDSVKSQIVEICKVKNYGKDYFVWVWVMSGGCFGLIYQMEFFNEAKVDDQVFEDNGEKVVIDLCSFIYFCNIMLEFFGGFNGEGFVFNNLNVFCICVCGESFVVQYFYFCQQFW